MLTKIAGIGLSLGCSLFVFAAGEPNLPFVNEKTVLFARVQTDRIDMGKIEEFILDSVGSAASSQPVDFSQFQAGVHAELGEAARWLREFKEAGGHEIDVIGQSDSMTRYGGALVVPLDADSNPRQIAALLISGHKDGQSSQPANIPAQVEIVPNKAVLMAPAIVREEFKHIVPVPRAEIAAAIAASDDAPEIVVLSPDTAFRLHLLRNLPRMMITQPAAPLVNGLQWLAQFSTPPPAISEHLLIQTNDPQIARQMAQLINVGLMLLQTMPNQTPAHEQSRAALAKLLAPHISDNRVEINLDGQRVVDLARALEPLFMRLQERQLQIKSASNMRELGQAIYLYRQRHKGDWPKTLNDTKREFGSPEGFESAMMNPRDPQRKPAYVYLKPSTPIANENQQMVLYEAHENFGDGVNVGFADGHVAFISNPPQFKDLLLQSLQQNTPDH